MKTYSKEELHSILKRHRITSFIQSDGKADLSYYDLSSIDLSGTRLSYGNFSYSNLSCTDLSYSNLNSSDLSHTNLSHADLSHADLSNVDLSNTNLSYATFFRTSFLGERINKAPLFIKGLYWDVIISETKIKIGCRLHTAEEWENFSDEEITVMDCHALVFWKQYKDTILNLWRNHNK